MMKSALLGSLVTVGCLIVFSVVMGLGLAKYYESMQGSFAHRHNVLIRMPIIQVATVLSWAIASSLGGFLAARRHDTKQLQVSLATGLLVLSVWSIPSVVIAGSHISWLHIICLVSIVPFALSGGLLASRVRT